MYIYSTLACPKREGLGAFRGLTEKDSRGEMANHASGEEEESDT